MGESRPEIPDAIKRAVRQRCGFGCVVCGLPLFEYEHIINWSIVREHTQDNLTLLCDRHHREKTSGLFPISLLEKANANPYNRRESCSPPFLLHSSGGTIKCKIGNIHYSYRFKGDSDIFIPLVLDNVPILYYKKEGDIVLFNLQILDEYGNKNVTIKDNELTFTTKNWDVELVGKRFLVRQALGKIILDLEIGPPNGVNINYASLKYKSLWFKIKSNGIVNQNRKTHRSQGIFRFEDLQVALVLRDEYFLLNERSEAISTYSFL